MAVEGPSTRHLNILDADCHSSAICFPAPTGPLLPHAHAYVTAIPKSEITSHAEITHSLSLKAIHNRQDNPTTNLITTVSHRTAIFEVIVFQLLGLGE